jgi:hypothetical protein
MTTTTPINIQAGKFSIDQSMVPAMRAKKVAIGAFDLKPNAQVNVFLNDTPVNNFIQPPNILTANTGFAANTLTAGNRLYAPTTGGYAEVIQVSQTTTTPANAYIDTAFVSLSMTANGPGNVFSQSDWAVNDIAIQGHNTGFPTATNTITFQGRVKLWDYANGVIVCETILGSPDVIGTGHGVLYNLKNNPVSGGRMGNVNTVIIGSAFPPGTAIISPDVPAASFTSNNHLIQAGYVVKVNTGNSFIFSGITSANYVGNQISIVAGSGIGQTGKIIAVNATSQISTLDNTWSAIDATSIFSIGSISVDNIGIAGGILRIPELDGTGVYNFPSGQQLITLTDGFTSADNGASMKAVTTYAATGSLAGVTVNIAPRSTAAANTVVGLQPPTSAPLTSDTSVSNNPLASPDPLVQTFFTPKPITLKVDYGIFCSSVNLFFNKKPAGSSTQFPVSVYICGTVNGFPDISNILGQTTVRYQDVNTTDGLTTFPDSANTSTYTNFKFPDPVYLAPGTEYGIVVYSESPDYFVWISQIGDTIINTNRLISQSPFLGSLFISQNASAWNPVQNQQLMFVLNKCVFSQAAVNMLFNIIPANTATFMDQVLVHSSDLTFPVANIAYGVKSIIANTGISDAGFYSVDVNNLLNYGSDLINSSVSSNRRRLIPVGNANSCFVQATMSTTDSDVSPFLHAERLTLMAFTNVINPGSIANTDISILTPGNHLNAANIIVTIGAPTGDGGIQATANITSNNITGNLINSVNMIVSGAGYIASPTITISEPGAPANATAVVNGEDKKFAGNGLTRYITRPITLADGFDAGDLQVFLNAIRPQGTNITVYYKVLSAQDTDPITNKSWKQMILKADIFSLDQKTAIPLTYTTGNNAYGVPNGSVAYTESGISYPLGGKFKTFAIKIVLTANDSTVPPIVQNMRAVAVPAG